MTIRFLFLVIWMATAILPATAFAEEPVARNDGSRVRYAWQETQEFGGKRVLLRGEQVVRPDGTEKTLYYDSDGKLLDEAFLAAHRKNWSGVAVSVPSEEYRGGGEALQATAKAVPRTAGLTLAADRVLERKLGPLDLAPILAKDAEEAQSREKGPLRIGVLREIAQPLLVDAGHPETQRWQTLGDGSRTLVVRLEAPEAYALRVEVADLRLPPGASFFVYNTDNPKEFFGPFDQDGLHGEDVCWTPSIFSSRVSVEFLIPPGRDASSVQCTIARLAHVYVNLDGLVLQQAGMCEKDVTCYSAWTATSHAVALIDFFEGTGEYLCTGSLFNDQDSATQIPYFMTANHCVGDQPVASTVEFYWFYQTSGCNGTPPSLSSVPRTTGGAAYLAGMTQSSGSDFAFLRMYNTPPTGVTFAGWSTATPGSGDTLTCIHHPDGDYKRISFGNLNNGTTTNYWHILWSTGTTEPGSSGSPLFNTSKQFIGQLWGGAAACDNLTGIDQYGRFNVTYPLIQQWLQGTAPTPTPTPTPPPGDAWDPGDDTGSGATLLANPTTSEQTHGPHTLTDTDRYDWFKVYLWSGNSYNFNTIGSSGDDYGELYSDAAGANLVALNDDGGGNLQFSLNYTAAATQYYYLRVRGYYSYGNACSYTLKYRITNLVNAAVKSEDWMLYE